jgi:Enoyl-CoA hydratase/carnithine racemase
MADEVLYEQRGRVALITLNRPQYANAQNSAMTYALDAAFARAVNDDDVAVLVLAGAGKHFCAGHDIGTPERDAEVSFDREAVLWWDHVGKDGRGRQVRPRDGGLPGHVPALAGDPQAVHRDGARRLHRRRADARLGVRPDRGGRRRVLRRPGGEDGHPGRGVLRAPVGARAAVRQGGAVHRGAFGAERRTRWAW